MDHQDEEVSWPVAQVYDWRDDPNGTVCLNTEDLEVDSEGRLFTLPEAVSMIHEDAWLMLDSLGLNFSETDQYVVSLWAPRESNGKTRLGCLIIISATLAAKAERAILDDAERSSELNWHIPSSGPIFDAIMNLPRQRWFFGIELDGTLGWWAEGFGKDGKFAEEIENPFEQLKQTRGHLWVHRGTRGI